MKKKQINERFKIAINVLLGDKELSKTNIAATLGIKPAKFSEILNGRMNAGVDTIAMLCEEYSFSASWILNADGPMLTPGWQKGRSKPTLAVPNIEKIKEELNATENSAHHQASTTQAPFINRLLDTMDNKDKIIKEQAEEIGQLKERIAQLEREQQKNASGAAGGNIANAG